MGLTADVGTDYFTGFKQLKLFNIRVFTNLQVGHQGFEEAANGGGAGPNPGQWGHDPFSIFQDVSTLHTLSIAVLLVLWLLSHKTYTKLEWSRLVSDFI